MFGHNLDEDNSLDMDSIAEIPCRNFVGSHLILTATSGNALSKGIC